MENNNLFSRHSLNFRPNDQKERVSFDRPQGDELRTMIHSLHNVMPKKILLIEEDAYYINVVGQAFADGIVTVTPTWQSALRLLTRELYDLVVIEVGRNEEIDMLDLMRLQRYNGDELNFFTPFIAMISEGFDSRTSEAVTGGCISAIQKPFSATMMRGLVLEHFNSLPSLYQGRTS